MLHVNVIFYPNFVQVSKSIRKQILKTVTELCNFVILFIHTLNMNMNDILMAYVLSLSVENVVKVCQKVTRTIKKRKCVLAANSVKIISFF